MKRIMLDSNVIIDSLAHRKPFCSAADDVMLRGAIGDLDLWMSASQVTDVFYILTGGGAHSRADEGKNRLTRLREHVHVCSIGEPEVDAALSSVWEDFEDACLYQAALKVRADAIVTRNQKDYRRSTIRVLTCEELLAELA